MRRMRFSTPALEVGGRVQEIATSPEARKNCLLELHDFIPVKPMSDFKPTVLNCNKPVIC